MNDMHTAAVPDPEDASPIDLMLFREVLATFPAGVVIVTAHNEDGTPAGLTCSAFCSVSGTPAMVLVCVDKGSNTLPAIQHSQAFTVNILAEGRQDLALLFASKNPDKFGGVAWEMPECSVGGPIFRNDAASYLVCKVDQAVEAGDHWVFIGEAIEAGIHDEPMPLLYHNRSFASLG